MQFRALPTTTAFPSASWTRQAVWMLWALVWFGTLGWRALISPDEGRYGTIALGMLQSGDWITPRLNGLLYFEKPILQYWISAASLQLFGIHEFAARFWPGMSGFLTVVAVAVTARRLWGETVSDYAGLTAAGMTWLIANSHFLSLDMGLTFFLTLALCGFLLAQRDEADAKAQRHAMWLCWAAMAGATLSKGLVGLLIPGATVVLYSLVQRRFDVWRRMHWLSGLAIFFALTAPWFIAVSLKNPGFFDFFFIREHFRRFLTDEAHRPGAPYYFIPFLLIGLLPWTTLLPALLRRGVLGDRRTVFQPERLLLIWSGFIFVFFSVSRSKLPSYILPMFPALALLAGPHLAQLEPARLKRHLLLPAALWLVALVGAPLAGHYASPDSPREFLTPFLEIVALAAVLFLVCAAFAWRWLGQQRKLAAVAALAFGSLLASTVTMIGHDQYGGRLKSSAQVVPQLAPYLKPDTEVFAVRYYDQSLPFYLRRSVTLVDFRDEFTYGQDAEPTRWLPTLDAFAERWQSLPQAAAMMTPQTFEVLQQRPLPMRVVYRDPGRVVVVKPEAVAP